MNARRRRTNIFLALITVVFFLAWTPSVLYAIFFDFFRSFLPERHSMVAVGYAFSLSFGLLTSIANPILYTSLNEGFREAAATSRVCCCFKAIWKADGLFGMGDGNHGAMTRAVRNRKQQQQQQREAEEQQQQRSDSRRHRLLSRQSTAETTEAPPNNNHKSEGSSSNGKKVVLSVTVPVVEDEVKTEYETEEAEIGPMLETDL